MARFLRTALRITAWFNLVAAIAMLMAAMGFGDAWFFLASIVDLAFALFFNWLAERGA